MNRVWTYVISKAISAEELEAIHKAGQEFVNGWAAHEQKLNAAFEIFKGRVVIVKVNEDIHNASGCSIDKLTRFIKDIETKFSVELMNRFLVAYKKDDKIEVVNASEIKDLLDKKTISADTIIYNTSLANSNELVGWEQSLKNTWLCKYL